MGKDAARVPTPQLRTQTISVRVNAAERAELDRRRAATGLKEMGAYMRRAVLAQCPPRAVVPAINREAWQDLARTAANLNQLVAHLNGGGRLDERGTARLGAVVAEVGDKVTALRLALLGTAEDEEEP